MLCVILSIILTSIILIDTVAHAQADAQTRSPIFLTADLIEYNKAEEFIYGRGHVKLRENNYLIAAGGILYDIKHGLIFVNNDIIIYDKKDRLILGNNALFKNNLKQGLISNCIIKWDKNVIIAANMLYKIDEDQSSLYKASFTPCQINDHCKPIWQISARETTIDSKKHAIKYQHVLFKLYGVPIVYTPYFSHPTPDAPAKSGLLIPSLVYDTIKIPFYYRAQPNLDFTLAPRISKQAIIYEFEMRHKIESGQYLMKNYYGYVPYKKRKTHSNYFAAQGNFGSDWYNYGFDLNFVSDKAFLKNYYNMYNAYLTSKLYMKNIDYENYYAVESMYFRGLKTTDNTVDPIIIPKIKTKNVLYLNDSGDLYFTIENNSLFYTQKNILNLAKTSFLFSLTKDVKTEYGHLFTINLNSREDLYIYRKSQEKVQTLRSIPTLQTTWRYPLVKTLEMNKSILLEPVVSTVLAPKYKDKYIKKFALIDPVIYELAEDNIFSGNRYSGTDYYEFGERVSYGLNVGYNTAENFFNVFLGQLLRTNNKLDKIDKLQNIGTFSFNMAGNFVAFYKYRKGKDFAPIIDEIGVNLIYEKISLTTSLAKLSNIKKYHTQTSAVVKKNNLTQAYYNIDYQLNDNWLVGSEMRFDLGPKSDGIISKSIRVTYFKDCVKIGVVFYDDYTSNSELGIRKNHNQTISIGLKVLNM